MTASLRRKFQLDMAPYEQSWSNLKYPSYRNEPDKSIDQWLKGRREDDGAEDFWRVHDDLYDLTSFVKQHPGGSMWLTLTRGTDITEAFEAHHLSKMAENKLPKFFVKKASTPRTSPYTFHEDGFYRTLKHKVQKHFGYKSPSGPSLMSTLFLDFYFHGGLFLCGLAAKQQSLALAMLAGLFFGLVVNCGHNFLHMKDTWRIYYYSSVGFSVREWRVSHCLSHHLHTNTLKDLEIELFEPFLQFLPNRNKSLFSRFGSWLLFPLVCTLTSVNQIIHRIVSNTFYKEDFLMFLPLGLMLLFGNFSLFTVFLWVVVMMFTGFTFTIIGLTAAHHDPDNFHEGDEPREDRDWGLHQFDAVVDRNEIMGNRFFGLIMYGEHTLHHFFPTVDFCYLQALTPIFHETLKEFGIELNQKPIFKVFSGTFLQLARNKPRQISKATL